MRIGEMTSMMMMASRNQNMFAQRYNQAQTQISTGKRVNSASDDPSAIGRIQRTKAEISASKIRQSAYDDAQSRNSMMETSLDSASSSTESLVSLAVQYSSQKGTEKTVTEDQAKSLLDNMVDTLKNTNYNGSNPFTDGSATFGNVTVNSPKFSITQNATNSANYDITLNDGTTLSNKSVTDILDSNFISDNLTDQIASAKSSIGISNNILDFRNKAESSAESVLTTSLSNLEDADLTKSVTDATVANNMYTLNQGLLTSYSQMFQNQVGTILNLRA